MTPSKKEVIKEVEKKASYVVPPPYKPQFPFSQRYVEPKVGTQSKKYVEILEKIIPMYHYLRTYLKREKLEDRETWEIIGVKRGRLTFEVGGERIKSKLEEQNLG